MITICSKDLKRNEGKLVAEEAEIIVKQESLKKVLYGRFGDSINLET